MLNPISNIAASALNYSSKSLEVSANNIANQQTTGQLNRTNENGTAYVARRAESVSNAEGGVRTQINPKNPAIRAVPAPEDVNANEDGLVAAPNVDTADEIINQKFASYSFDASLKVLKVADELTGNLLDLEA